MEGPQVFINFRGDELRLNFVDSLVIALRAARIKLFIDSDEQVGRTLRHLLVRIDQSKVALAIFSKEYTTSVWCLDELVRIKERMDDGKLTGIPIFYKVDPSVVSNLEGDFGDKFRRLQRENQHDQVRTQKWKEALTYMTGIVGVHLREGSGKAIDIATLKEVYWMNIKGNFLTSKLTPETKYEVVFVVKLEEDAIGWHKPVNLTLTLTMRDNTTIQQEQTCLLDTYVGDEEWVDIKAGEFVAPPKEAPARISFAMFQHDDTVRKTGLVVKGVAFRAVD